MIVPFHFVYPHDLFYMYISEYPALDKMKFWEKSADSIYYDIPTKEALMNYFENEREFNKRFVGPAKVHFGFWYHVPEEINQHYTMSTLGLNDPNLALYSKEYEVIPKDKAIKKFYYHEKCFIEIIERDVRLLFANPHYDEGYFSKIKSIMQIDHKAYIDFSSGELKPIKEDYEETLDRSNVLYLPVFNWDTLIPYSPYDICSGKNLYYAKMINYNQDYYGDKPDMENLHIKLTDKNWPLFVRYFEEWSKSKDRNSIRIYSPDETGIEHWYLLDILDKEKGRLSLTTLHVNNNMMSYKTKDIYLISSFKRKKKDLILT